MSAPSGGFFTFGSSVGSGVSEFVFHRTRHAVVGLNSIASVVRPMPRRSAAAA